VRDAATGFTEVLKLCIEKNIIISRAPPKKRAIKRLSRARKNRIRAFQIVGTTQIKRTRAFGNSNKFLGVFEALRRFELNVCFSRFVQYL
jgi:hypothetical protein